MDKNNELVQETVVEVADVKHYVYGRNADGTEVRLEVDEQGNPVGEPQVVDGAATPAD